MDRTESKIEVFSSINEIMQKYGKIQVPYDTLESEGVDHILVREGGYLRFSLVTNSKGVFKMISKDYTDFIKESIEGFKGVYGYLGVNAELLNNIKEHQELGTDEKVFIASVDYEGPYYVVNSGRYGGMIIITENFQSLNFKNMKS